MKPDKGQIEQIQMMLYDEGASVVFPVKGKTTDGGYWYLTKDGVDEGGPSNEKGDLEFYKDRDIDSLLAFLQKNDPVAIVNLSGSREGDETFEDWDHLARYMGITDLVVLSTKVPKRIAEKFHYYTTKTTTDSANLRKMVYDYVVAQIKENAEEDAFR